MLDASIVNVALPSIQSDLGFGPASVTWVVNAYVLAFAGLLLLSGRAADLFGRRRVFVAGASLLTFGTLVAASAVNPELLIAGRLVQGVGAAALSPAAMSMLLSTFPRAAGQGDGHLGWCLDARWCKRGGRRRASRRHRRLEGGLPGDSPGVADRRRSGRHLLVEGARGLRRTFEGRGGRRHRSGDHPRARCCRCGRPRLTSPRAAAPAPPSVPMAAFLSIERRAEDPLFPLELFRSRALGRGVVFALLGGGVRASTFVLVALYFQQFPPCPRSRPASPWSPPH